MEKSPKPLSKKSKSASAFYEFFQQRLDDKKSLTLKKDL